MKVQSDFFEDPIIEVEKELLDLADYLYVNSNIKPYSRVIFILSRLIALNSDLKNINNPKEALSLLKNKYPDLLKEQDYNSNFLFNLIGKEFKKIKNVVLNVLELAPKGTDTLGLIFNTLLRGKFEAGEGLGTFLTPEEVVNVMVNLSIFYFKKFNKNFKSIKFADITGGTGRFLYKFNNVCKVNNIKFNSLIADQSKFSLDLAKINFILSGDIKNVDLIDVIDSIIDKNLKKYSNKVNIICTNPPFGTNKYLYSSDLENIFSKNELKILNMEAEKSKNDPAIIFFLRNLKLLDINGIMSIVLPDGVVYSNQLYEIINQRIDDCYINVLTIISLPVSTFSLGGTVAKTSFVIVQKSTKKFVSNVYTATAEHIGFLKKGNNKILDKNGNELEQIENDIISNKLAKGNYSNIDTALKRKYIDDNDFTKNNSVLVREYLKYPTNANNFHISILDVDETGFIDFEKIINNSPVTKPLVCKPYDILISCINPRIWRATIIPEIKNYMWTCSSEFAVFRCNNIEESLRFYFSIMQENYRIKALKLAKGTSSSRQRINKNELLKLKLSNPSVKQLQDLKKLMEIRHSSYLRRLEDLKISISLWGRAN